MKRILWMVLMNLWYVPYGIIRLFQMAAHPERYSLEERYALIRQIDNRAIKGGRVVIQGDGMDRLPKDDGFILYPNHQGMFDVLAILWLLDRPVSVVLKKELQNHVKKLTAPYKYPRVIEFVDELPKTISGKIRRVELRERDSQKANH